MYIKRKFFSLAPAGTLAVAGFGVMAPSALAEDVQTGQVMAQTSQAPTTDHEVTVTDNGHTYTVKYVASDKRFVGIYDGKHISTVSYNEMKDQLEKAKSVARMDRSACGWGMAAVGIINGALWTGAAITAPASAGTTIALASFATSLIPTVGGAIAR